jgi:hypothetical protein
MECPKCGTGKVKKLDDRSRRCLRPGCGYGPYIEPGIDRNYPDSVIQRNIDMNKPRVKLTDQARQEIHKKLRREF